MEGRRSAEPLRPSERGPRQASAGQWLLTDLEGDELPGSGRFQCAGVGPGAVVGVLRLAAGNHKAAAPHQGSASQGRCRESGLRGTGRHYRLEPWWPRLDGMPASIEVLPEVVQAVGGRAEVYIDGGIRRGTDVLIALALGARAVLIGRPYTWALA